LEKEKENTTLKFERKKTRTLPKEVPP